MATKRLVKNGRVVVRDNKSLKVSNGDVTCIACHHQAFRCDNNAALDLWAAEGDVTAGDVFLITAEEICAYWGPAKAECPGTIYDPGDIEEYEDCEDCETRDDPIPCCPPLGTSLFVTLADLVSCFDNCSDGSVIDITSPPPFDGVYPVPIVVGAQTTTTTGEWGYKYSANPCILANRTDSLDNFQVTTTATLDFTETCIAELLVTVNLRWSGPWDAAAIDRTPHGGTPVFAAKWVCTDGVLVPADPGFLFPTCPPGTATLEWV